MISFERLPAAPQLSLTGQPYDKWVTPIGGVAAEFHRLPGGYLARFPDQADFEICPDQATVRAIPVPDTPNAGIEALYCNAILPLIGNHAGELNLHGSGISTSNGAIAFLGTSRSGKTTLAGSFAKQGHPFLTEDVIALSREGNSYSMQPQRPVLRLFHDSASWLLGSEPDWQDRAVKTPVSAGSALPFADQPQELKAIYLLGPGTSQTIQISRLGPAQALTSLLEHAFILDVEDKVRLAGHFARLGDLVENVACHALDYPRRYSQLPALIETLLKQAAKIE